MNIHIHDDELLQNCWGTGPHRTSILKSEIVSGLESSNNLYLQRGSEIEKLSEAIWERAAVNTRFVGQPQLIADVRSG